MGVQPPLVFSSDGSRVAFVSDVYPDCADEACNKRKSEEADKNPVKVHRLTRLLYRHWDEWRENVRHHVFVADVAGRPAIDVTPGDFDSPPAQQEDGAIAFSPDGREIAFASNREGGDREAWTTNHDIWTVSSAGGAVRKITTNPASDLQPVYSPDGRTLFVRAQRRPGFESDRWYLDAYDRSTGAKRTVFHIARHLGWRLRALSRRHRRSGSPPPSRGARISSPFRAPVACHVVSTNAGSISSARPGAGFAICFEVHADSASRNRSRIG